MLRMLPTQLMRPILPMLQMLPTQPIPAILPTPQTRQMRRIHLMPPTPLIQAPPSLSQNAPLATLKTAQLLAA